MKYLRALDARRVEWRGRVSDRWQSLARAHRFGILLVLAASLYIVPLMSIPFLTIGDTQNKLYYPVCSYVLVALGLNVVVGRAGLLDLGYVAFFAVGAYTVAVLGTAHGSLPWLVCVPIGVAVAMGSGALLGAPTLRLRGDYLAIVTLGFGELIRTIARNVHWLGAADGISGLSKPPSIGFLKFDVLHPRPYYWLALTVIYFVVFGIRRLERSRVGRAWTAIREDEDAAEIMGVPIFRYKLWAFAIGAAVGGLAGTIYGGYVDAVTPETFIVQLSIFFLAAVVIGGSGNMPGVILGAIVISYLPERFRWLQDKRIFLFGLALVVMMALRPQGILPARRHREVETSVEQPDFPGLAGADLSESLFGPPPEGHDG